MKHRLLLGAAILALGACSAQKSDEATRGESAASDAVEAGRSATAAADAASETPPDIDTSVAPGVAFDFEFGFSLPENQIAAAQEEHARLCSRIGISRCRITNLTFQKERDGTVNAAMAFRLDPALALSFGRDASELVEQKEGKLETSSLTGEDAGSAIVEGDRSAAAFRANLKRIEAQLAIPKLSAEVRQQLMEEARQIRSELSRIKTTRDQKVEDLATAPVRFTYEPSGTVLGFERGSAIQTGLSTGLASLSAVGTVLAFALGAFGPWLLLAGAGVFAWRRWRKPRKSEAEA